MYYITALIIVSLAILMLISDIYIKPQFTLDENGYHTTITAFTFFRLLKFRRQVGSGGNRKPGRSKGKDDPAKNQSVLEIYDELIHLRSFYHSYESAIHYIIKKMRIEEIKIVTAIGTYDACLTAICVGIACTAAGMSIAVLTNILNECKKEVCIVPDFSGNRFNLNLYCIFRTRFAYIIVAGLKYLTTLIVRKANKSKNLGAKH